jgi:hypothetical protein
MQDRKFKSENGESENEDKQKTRNFEKKKMEDKHVKFTYYEIVLVGFGKGFRYADEMAFYTMVSEKKYPEVQVWVAP